MMKSSNLYSEHKNKFKIDSKHMNREENKLILKICVYIIFIFEM